MKKMLISVVALGCLAVAIALINVPGSQHSFTFTGTSRPVSSLDERAVPTSESSPSTDDWPQWRGRNRDGKSSASQLLANWPEAGPPLLWTAKGLGRGMSSVSISDGRLFTMGKLDAEVFLIARKADSGEPLWTANLDADGEPNGTPTIHGDHAYAVSYDGKIVCAESATGRIVWRKDFVADFGGTVPQWGYSESPLVDGQIVACTPGSDETLIVALGRSKGETVWATRAPSEMRGDGHDGAGYSSIVVGSGAGVRQYVQLVGRGVIGVSPIDGTPLWGYNRIANGVANIPTPVVHEDYVFASSGYGAGSALLRLTPSAGGIQAKEVYFHPGNKMQNHHGGMVLVEGHVYFGHGQNNGLPMCVELQTGNVKWGPVRGPGAESAAVIYADGHLYFRYQNAVMALVEATPDEFRLKSSFKLPHHLDNNWPQPVISNGRLYLRDQDVLMCYDLRGQS